MSAELCGHALSDLAEEKFDALLEYCGNLESEVKDLGRRVALLEELVVRVGLILL